ncbi:ferredoxin [Clostridium sp. YIM B02505]|uniref:Ferredoxin n=1 Tax=Clostridium yunnanense TaxID=2800325 RepID=A0ABS1ELK5_9CLOT|nr:ferredoxin [Clostridium yunnanense]MBK1810255.1 ferredoxin [Clostridium yunnanense]
MKACVDREACIGCGLCASINSKVFCMEEDGKAVATEVEILDSELSITEEAASSCPVCAISLQ